MFWPPTATIHRGASPLIPSSPPAEYVWLCAYVLVFTTLLCLLFAYAPWLNVLIWMVALIFDMPPRHPRLCLLWHGLSVALLLSGLVLCAIYIGRR